MSVTAHRRHDARLGECPPGVASLFCLGPSRHLPGAGPGRLSFELAPDDVRTLDKRVAWDNAMAVGLAATAEPAEVIIMKRKQKTTARRRASLKRKARKRQERKAGRKRVRGSRKRR